MKKEEFIFCPLGGSGEIGMNMNLFAYGNPENRKWIIVDIGVTFADDTTPGIDLIYPDPGFIVDKKDDLVGLVLTHAHEDHIGAIAHIWPKLLCNIYATPFTSVLIQEKFKEKKIIGKNTLEALRSGFYWGYSGLINNIILKIENETKKKYKIIFTGGYANLFKTSIIRPFKIDRNITIKGVIEIFKKNKKYLN